jgi:hypothetical protein
MKMMAVIVFETSASTRATTQRRIPEDRPCHHLSIYENLNSREFAVIVRKEMVV